MLQAFDGVEYEFYIFCGNRDLDGTVLNVLADSWNPYAANCRVWYSSNQAIGNALKQAVVTVKPDIFFVIGIYDLAYNFKPLLQWKHIPKIVSVRGMLHPGALAQKSLKKRLYLASWKLLGLHRRIIFHATSDAEKGFIEACFGKNADVRVAGNIPASSDLQQLLPKQKGYLKMCTIALISPMKNHLKVLEALKETAPAYQIEYDIYGPVKDKGYWGQCETLIKQMPAHVKVQYHGDIPPGNILQALAQTHIVIQPSESENYGHALYEALLAGRPLITSENTPWNKLRESQAGINVDPHNREVLINAIAYYAILDNENYQHCCQAARQYALQAVDMEAIKEQYRRLFLIN